MENEDNHHVDLVEEKPDYGQGIMAWYYRFLDSNVKDTPNGWIVPLVAWVTALLSFVPGYIVCLVDADSCAKPGLLISFGAIVLWLGFLGIFAAPFSALFNYWVVGGYKHLFIRIVGGRGYMLTRRLMLYLGFASSMVWFVFGLIYGVASLSDILSTLAFLYLFFAFLAYVWFYYFFAYKGFKHLMGLSVGRFILGYIVLPWVVVVVLFLLFWVFVFAIAAMAHMAGNLSV